MSRYEVAEVKENIPYEEITEVLHNSYRGHSEQGLQYLAARQDVETTKKRMEGAHCVIAKDGEKIVATMIYKIISGKDLPKRKWYQDDLYMYGGQLAVLPEYRDKNVMSLVGQYVRRNDAVRATQSSIMDTSCEAKKLVEQYLKMGYQIVDLVSWETTNYYSYIFRKPNKTGRKYSNQYCKIRFWVSSVKCRILYDKNGKKRF